MSEKEKIRLVTGEELEIDISDETCEPFGFKHGDKLFDPDGDSCTFVGVAVDPRQPDLAAQPWLCWGAFHQLDEASLWDYFDQPTDLREAGFRAEN